MTAVVFDMDGTLTDTEHIWDVVRRQLAASEGLSWPEEATTAMMGMSTQQWSTYLSEVVGLSGTPQEAAERTIDGMQVAYRSGIELLPGAREAVRRMA
ncbi:MAG: HAD family hydrolase, partial [Propionicimonas sp.]